MNTQTQREAISLTKGEKKNNNNIVTKNESFQSCRTITILIIINEMACFRILSSIESKRRYTRKNINGNW